MADDVDLGDGRYAYAVRRRPVMQAIMSEDLSDDDLGIYPERTILGYEQVGWEPDVPAGFPGTKLVFERLNDGTPLVWDRGASNRRGQWMIVVTIEAAGALLASATYPADSPRITGVIADPFGVEGPSLDYVSAGDPWDFFDVTPWALDGAKLPGRLKGVGT
jgi:hypothetical protein